MRGQRTSAPSSQAGVALVGLLAAMVLGGCTGLVPAGEVELTRADDWRLVVTEDQELAVVSTNGRASAGDFTRPPTLNEAGVRFLNRDGLPVTLVSGPVHADATTVVVGTLEGVRSEAQVVEAYGMKWFWTELPGQVRPSELVARNAERVVDEFTLPPMPGPAPAPERGSPPP